MSAWNDERESLLATLWAAGLSASQIASRLGGGLTRNAVIGKRIRLKLPDRGPSRPQRTYRKKLTPRPKPWRPTYLAQATPAMRAAAAEMRRESLRTEPDLVIPPKERRSLLDLEPSECRWPFGSGSKEDPFYFCGKEKVAGLPYCPFHSARAFIPPQPRRSRPPAPGQPSAVEPAVAVVSEDAEAA